MVAGPHLVLAEVIGSTDGEMYSSTALLAASEREGRCFATHCAGQNLFTGSFKR